MKFIHPPFAAFVQADCVPDGHVVEGQAGSLGIKCSHLGAPVILWESGQVVRADGQRVLDLGEATISVYEERTRR